MRKNALVFLHLNPFPPRSGVQKRAMEMIGGLRDAGCRVTLASSTLWDKSWNTLDRSACPDWVDALQIYEPNVIDWALSRGARWFYEKTRREPPLRSFVQTPPGMSRWFRRTLRAVRPDVLVMNYAFSDTLLGPQPPASALCIMETIDLTTLNSRMWRALQKRLPPPPLRVSDVDADALETNFYDRQGLTAAPEEFRIFDKYAVTLAIAQEEAEIIRQNTQHTKALYVPMTQEPHLIANRYDGPALLPIGPNPFNLQGVLYFIKHVLPRVREKCPEFCLQVTGQGSQSLAPEPGVLLSGMVPDLDAVYASARLMVCPVYGGTGQQVKIVEAMASGLPVVALRFAAARSPIEPGVSGLVAENADEFAAHVVRLWNDPALCRAMGEAAREAVRARCSREHLVTTLSSLLELPPV